MDNEIPYHSGRKLALWDYDTLVKMNYFVNWYLIYGCSNNIWKEPFWQDPGVDSTPFTRQV